MINILLLNFYLLLYFIAVIFENNLDFNISYVSKSVVKKLPWYFYIVVLILYIFIIFYLFFNLNNFNLRIFLIMALSFSIFAHFRFIIRSAKKFSSKLYFLALLVIIIRFLTNIPLIHNIFIILAISWLGIFLKKLGLINKKLVVIISIIWFLYDIYFVWISNLSEEIIIAGKLTDFTLGLVSGDNFLGTGDLLWSGIYLSVLRNELQKVVATLFLLSNIILNILVYYLNIPVTFPLLVLWVPIGLGWLVLNKVKLLSD